MDITETKRERMERLFAEVEAELHGTTIQTEVHQKVLDDERCNQSLNNAISQPPQQIAGNIREWIKDDVFKTKRERFLANAYMKLFDSEVLAFNRERKEFKEARPELEMLRNFTKAVALKLEKAEATAREQDNHHYYKIFAESVKALLEKL